MNCKLSKSLTTNNNDSTIVAEPIMDVHVITTTNTLEQRRIRIGYLRE